MCVIHVWGLHAADVLSPCTERSEGSGAIAYHASTLFVASQEGVHGQRSFSTFLQVTVKCFFPELLGKTIVDGLPGMDFLQEFPEPWDLTSLQSKSNGASDHMEIFGHGDQGGAGPGLAGQPDSACDIASDNFLDEGFQVWATGEDHDDLSCGILDHLHHLLDLFVIRILRDELTEVDADVPFLCFLSELLDPWPAIVVISCDCAHPVPAEILNNVCHGCGLVFIVWDGTEEGLELIFIAEESAGGGVAHLERTTTQSDCAAEQGVQQVSKLLWGLSFEPP